MFTNFTSLAAVGIGFRLALSWGLQKRYDPRLTLPQTFAVVLLVLAGLPGWLSPIPLPFSLMLGADLLTKRNRA